MTAEQYVKDVGHFLRCRTSKKKEIKKQILTEINSAVQKGECLECVLERMGIAWEYAQIYNDQFTRAEKKAAKREKRLRIGAVVLLFITIIVAVVYAHLPRWHEIGGSAVFEEEQVKAAAKEIVMLYSAGEYQAMIDQMSEEAKEMINIAALQYAKAQVAEDFGALTSMGEQYVSEAELRGKHFAVVEISAVYANASVTYTITFDSKMRLAGFYLK